ncbi:MAG: hypothetical protein AAGL90_09645 [Pseudomonadota bacterium]
MPDLTVPQAKLDLDRSWPVDQAQAPVQMNWLATFLNPTGKSPPLHFTRAWTVLFFVGVISSVGLGAILLLLGIAGAKTEQIALYYPYWIAGIAALTTVLSFIIHVRRLNHAGKSNAFALIVILPLVVGSMLFLFGVTEKAAEYDALYQARGEYLADPDKWRQEHFEQGRVDGALASGSRNRPNAETSPRPDEPLPSKESYIVRPNVTVFYFAIIGLSGLVMIWSLLWVARTSNLDERNEARI